MLNEANKKPIRRLFHFTQAYLSYQKNSKREAIQMNIKMLNTIHNIISINQEDVPKSLRGHTLLFYLQEQDIIVLSGWGRNTVQLADLIVNYMEFLSEGQVMDYTQLSDKVIRISRVIEQIAQIRIGKGGC